MNAPSPQVYRMTLAEFRRTCFLGRPPSANTIKAAIARGQWAGERVGGLYFVLVDAYGQPMPGRPVTRAPAASTAPDSAHARQPRTGNAAADQLLLEYMAG